MEPTTSNSKTGVWVIVIVIVIILIIIGVVLASKSSDTTVIDNSNTATPQQQTNTPDTSMPAATTTTSGITSGVTKSFTVAGSNYKFSLTQIKVSKGDTVKITFTNSGGQHDLSIPDFNVKTDKIDSGQSQTISFVADKTGSFEYYCSVGQHRAMGMKGTLIVE